VIPARALAALVTALAAAVTPLAQEAPPDLVIENGTVIDGAGRPGVRADIAISRGRIVGVGRGAGRGARDRIDARGLIVAPGFIDVHTHADDIAATPFAENLVRMGVTSIVAGNCGSSPLDIGAALERIADVGVSVNFATLVGHNSIRRAVMGLDRRHPRPDEMQKMRSLVFRGMADGAVGFSTGLQYVPGTYAESPEIILLAKVAAEEGGLYATHLRNEGTRIVEAVEEALEVGSAAQCPVQISHLKIDSPSRWRSSRTVLAMIDEARRRGVDVRADQYAYTAASSGLGIRFPAWALEGGQEAMAARLNDPRTWSAIKREILDVLAERGLTDLSFAVVASYEADPSINGLPMPRVAATWRRGDASIDAQLEAARTMMLAGGASMVYHLMSDDDVTAIMRHREVAFASDSAVLAPGDGTPHPRGYGNTARVLAHYVRERRVIDLPEAIRKMTSLPASHFGFADRGSIAEGFAADLVIVDPSAVADRATFEKPHQFAAGIPHVIVNGVPVVRDGRHTGARPGQILRSSRRDRRRP
jgi:N-acyl-D-amino-acid deacylase